MRSSAMGDWDKGYSILNQTFGNSESRILPWLSTFKRSIMTNPLALVCQLDKSIATKRSAIQPLKSRRQRRQEERDRIKSLKK